MNIELYKQALEEFKNKKTIYDKMYEYYKGNTDAMRNYKMITERNNNKTPVNFIKKFIKEEASYSVGNTVTYTSKAGNDEVINAIDYYTANIKEDHDSILARYMLIFGKAYELAYVNKNGDFNLKVIKANEGYFYDDEDNSFFIHIYRKKLDTKNYVDVYTNDEILHFDEEFNVISKTTPHSFGTVPIGIAELSEEAEFDTIYNDIKGLQDSYETNLSDISNEISDFRNAYLKIINAELKEEDLPQMKKQGIIQAKSSNKNVEIEWLIKNINDSFIQNTLMTLEDKMYQITAHINHNEKMQSNLSGLTLRNRLISLEEKCKLNQKALTNCIKIRLQLLFKYLDVIESKIYDYRDISIKFTPNVPHDDMLMAQIISQLGDKLSTETGLSLLSFINNPALEIEKINKEQEAYNIGDDLLNGEDDE